MALTDDNNMIMPVMPYGGSGGCGNGWGGDWAWILLLLLIFGWGNGFGNGNNGAMQGALTRNDLCSEFSFQDVKNGITANGDNMQSGFRNIDNAVCTLGYNNAQLANGIQMQLANEFRGLDNAVCTLGYNTQQGFNQTNLALMQGQNALQSQLAQCCCDNREAIAGVNYNMASQACDTRQTINTGIRDLIDNQNANYRALHDEIVANRIEDKNAQIAAQQQQIFALQLQASQAQQTNDIVNTVRPCPIPSYQTCNPWAGNSNCSCGYAA